MGSLSIFLITLFATMAVARIIVFTLPCRNLTHYLRHKTFLYIHHIYIGLTIMAITFPLIVLYGIGANLLIVFTIGLSLALDEMSAWISYSQYPMKKEFLITLLVYVVFSAYVIILFNQIA